MDENYDANDDYKDGNEGLKDPERRERGRPCFYKPGIRSEFDIAINKIIKFISFCF